MPKNPRRHNGFIRTARSQRYVKKSLETTLADPQLRPFCAWAGGLFPGLEKDLPTTATLEAIFKNQHPTTGRSLKRVMNVGSRLSGGIEVSNVCHGFTVAFAAPKEVSIAALVLGDRKLLGITCKVFSSELQQLAKLAERRRPRPRPRHVRSALPTGKAEILLVPEPANRRGQPFLHVAATALNLTSYTVDEKTRYCALHFGRIAKAVSALRKIANKRLYRALKRHGYVVVGRAEKWTLAGIPAHAVSLWTTKKTETEPFIPGAFSAVELNRRARRRDDHYNRTKPKKLSKSLADWQEGWRAELGEEQFQSMCLVYQAVHNAQRPRCKHRTQKNARPLPQVIPALEPVSVLSPIRKQTLLAEVTPRPAPPPSDRKCAPEFTSVLNPISKLTMLAEATGINTVQTPPLRCTDILSASLHLSQQFSANFAADKHLLRQVFVIGDTARYPWIQVAATVLELSFPGTQFRVKHQAGASPVLQMNSAATKSNSAQKLGESARDLLGKLASLAPTEMNQLGELLEDGRCTIQASRRKEKPRSPADPNVSGLAQPAPTISAMSPMSPSTSKTTGLPALRIFFPVTGKEYDYFQDLAPFPDLRTEILRQQRTHQRNSHDVARYARCLCCENPLARYVVRARESPDNRIHFCVARFPNSGRHHSPTCADFRDDNPPAPDEARHASDLRPGDLSALFKGAHDPERRRQTGVSSVRTPGANRTRRRGGPTAASLRTLGRILLEDSGICTCTPGFVRSRGFREVNGLAFGTLRQLQAKPESRYGKLLVGIPENVLLGPWSLAASPAVDAAGAASVALGFGFVIAITAPTPTGNREFILANAPAKKLLVRGSLLAEAITVPNFPTDNEQLRYPVWAIFIAGYFSGQWKVIKLALFRMTKIGLIPVESVPEERMVEHLIRERRTFRRCLQPPVKGCPYIPDFILLDTEPPHYLEVAGRSDEKYLKHLLTKQKHWAGMISTWYSHQPVSSLKLPAANITPPPWSL